MHVKTLDQWMLVMLAGILPAIGYCDVVTLENDKGVKIEAEIVSVDDENVTFTRAGKTHTYQLSMLSLSTREELKKWGESNESKPSSAATLATEYNISVFTGKDRKNKATDDFDDKRTNLEPVITIKNITNMRTRAAKLTCLFLGRPVTTRGATYVFAKESFDLPELPPQESVDFRMKRVSEPYDNRGYARFGSIYSGYIAIVHDPDGNEVFSCRAAPDAIAANAAKFLELKAKQAYDKEFNEVELPRYVD